MMTSEKMSKRLLNVVLLVKNELIDLNFYLIDSFAVTVVVQLSSL